MPAALRMSSLRARSHPVDWGMSDVPARVKARRCLRRLSLLLDRYRPDALLIREVSERRTEGDGSRQLLAAIEEEARGRGLFTVAVSRKQIRETFAHLGSPSRYAIAEAIAKHIPMFAFIRPANQEDLERGG